VSLTLWFVVEGNQLTEATAGAPAPAVIRIHPLVIRRSPTASGLSMNRSPANTTSGRVPSTEISIFSYKFFLTCTSLLVHHLQREKDCKSRDGRIRLPSEFP
jgi:hypothetical protein